VRFIYTFIKLQLQLKFKIKTGSNFNTISNFRFKCLDFEYFDTQLFFQVFLKDMNSKTFLKKSVKLLFVFFFLLIFMTTASSVTFASSSDSFSTHLDEWNLTPNGAVLLIVDGMGSYYLFPELKGETLEGESIQKASCSVLPDIYKNGFRISEMTVPVPMTEIGHSVLVTGNPSADSEMVGYTDSTIMDALRKEGFLCIGVMQRGDFESMRQKFDVIAYDKTNSVNNMEFIVQTNEFADSNKKVVQEITSVLESHKNRASSYTNTKNISDKYAGYNRWGLDAAVEVLSVMEKYPDQKFILVVNVGAVDSTGHYRGYYAYLEVIENLDSDLTKLYEKCRRNNIFLLITADHGMSFESQSKKSGGHSSAKYSKTKESLSIPFIVYGNNVLKDTIHYHPALQEDIAPTLISLFNLPNTPRFSKGSILPVKEKPSFHLESPEPIQIQLYQLTGDGQTQVFNSLGFNRDAVFSNYSISGLPPGKYLLQWETKSSKISYSQNEVQFQLTSDTKIDLSDYLKKPSFSFFNSSENNNSSLSKKTDFASSLNLSKSVLILLIAVLNLAGVGTLYYIYKKKEK